MTEEMSKKVIEFTQDYYRYSLRDDDKFCIERDMYGETLSKDSIHEILNTDNPDEVIIDLDNNNDDWYYEDEFFKELYAFCESNGIDEDVARTIVDENFYWAYPDSYLNPDVSTMWIVNHGDINHDFTLHNILNYAANYGYCNGLGKSAGLWWLAKQQGHLGELKLAINDKSPKTYFTSSELISKIRNHIFKFQSKRYYSLRELERADKILHQVDFLEYFVNRDGEKDDYCYNSLVNICKELKVMVYKNERSKFTESCITELENCSHYMTALQFMVRMPLQKILKIKRKIADMENDKEFNKYHPADCKKDFGYIVLDKSTMCGLFEAWGDGGSLMEIELEKDVKLPLKYLWDIRSNKKYQECCGVVESCWKETIKEVKLKEIA